MSESTPDASRADRKGLGYPGGFHATDGATEGLRVVVIKTPHHGCKDGSHHRLCSSTTKEFDDASWDGNAASVVLDAGEHFPGGADIIERQVVGVFGEPDCGF